MRIAILNTHDIQGGAAKAAWRLHRGLSASGHESHMLVLHEASADARVHVAVGDGTPATAATLAAWNDAAERCIRRRRTDLSETWFTGPVPGLDVASHPVVRASDVVHLHWVADLVTSAGVRSLQALGRPLVWTLHDQRPFTGGCHYGAGCIGYERACAGCPQLAPASVAVPRATLAEARRLVDPRRVTVVCPSHWMASTARASALFRESRVEVIPNGLETDVYIPRDRAAARAALGLPPGGFWFLFGAGSATDRRKGTHVLLEALRACRRSSPFEAALERGDVRFLTYGWASESYDYGGVPVHSLGFVNEAERMALAYAAADVFVCPTLEDNLPNTILESLSCGRPVIASDVGGVPDLVREGVSGLLVPPGDAHALSRALLAALRVPQTLAAWGAAAAERIQATHSLAEVARRHLELYEELAREGGARPEALTAASEALALSPPAWDWADAESPASPAGDALAREASARRDVAAHDAAGLAIWRGTQHLSGWMDEAAGLALAEAARTHGHHILELGGEGGREAAVALRAALAGRPEDPPQYVGFDTRPGSLARTQAALGALDVHRYARLVVGGGAQAVEDLPFVPTLVIVTVAQEFSTLRALLRRLQVLLAPGTPLFIRGYGSSPAVRAALHAALLTPFFRLEGLFGDGAALRTTSACRGAPQRLLPEEFARWQASSARAHHAPVDGTQGGHGGQARSPAHPPPPTMPRGVPWPRISILTPSLNRRDELARTLLSIADQGYPDVEHVVLDGGSTDDSEALVRAASATGALWVGRPADHAQLFGEAAWSRTTGDVVAWLACGQVLAPGALFAVALGLCDSVADLLLGVVQRERDGRVVAEELTPLPEGALDASEIRDVEHDAIPGPWMPPPGVFLRRSLLQRVGAGSERAAAPRDSREFWQGLAKAGAYLRVIGCPVVRTPAAAGPLPASAPARGLRLVFFSDTGFFGEEGVRFRRLALAAALAGHDALPVSVGSAPLRPRERVVPFPGQVLQALRRIAPDAVVVGSLEGAGLGRTCLSEIAETFPTIHVSADGRLFAAADNTPDADGLAEVEATALRRLLSARGLVLAAFDGAIQRRLGTLLALHAADAYAARGRVVRLATGGAPDEFRARDKAACRRALGLPETGMLILFPTARVPDPRFAVEQVLLALRAQGLPAAHLLCVDGRAWALPDDRAEVRRLLPAPDVRVRALRMSAVDMCVVSRLDPAFQQVMREAAACGTPCLAHPDGDVPAFVEDSLAAAHADHAAQVNFPAALTAALRPGQGRAEREWWRLLEARVDASLEATSRTLQFALRAALRRFGRDVMPSAQLHTQAPTLRPPLVLLEVLGEFQPRPSDEEALLGSFTPPPGMPDVPVDERALLDRCDRALRELRRSRLLWSLRPSGWLLRIRRAHLRRALTRRARRLLVEFATPGAPP